MDDFLHEGDQLFERLMNKLRVRFSAGKVEEKTFKYIGFGIQQLPSKIILDHSEYTDNIKNVTIDHKRASEDNEPLKLLLLFFADICIHCKSVLITILTLKAHFFCLRFCRCKNVVIKTTFLHLQNLKNN